MRFLFRDGEHIEIRAKSASDPGLGWRGWVTLDDLDNLLGTIIPVNSSHERNIWAGVCPRREQGSGVPALARVVWVDVDGVMPEEVMHDCRVLGLPVPSMVVDSGHGTHVFWALDADHAPEDIRPVTRWLSANVPGADGGTHDPTRVLRVPGTTNFKEPVAYCLIVEHTKAKYPLSVFPTQDTRVAASGRMVSTVSHPKEPLGDALRAEFAAIWQPGQRHQAALAIAGFMRKMLHWSELETTELLRDLHFSLGGVPGDENDLDLRHCVVTTYAKPAPFIRGWEALRDLGVDLDAAGGVVLAPKTPVVKPSRVSLINFSEPLSPQEFWVDGLVGPGLLTMIAAQPKAGKSAFAMQLGHSLANGLAAFDFSTDGRKHPVLYFQGELSQGMVYERATNMFPRGTFEDARMFGMTDKPEKLLDLNANPEPLMDLAEHYDVVIIDPLSVFSSNDENSVTSVRETLALFDVLKSQGKAVILVHHTRKLDTDRQGNTAVPSVSDIRGSSAWFAAVDAVGLLYAKGQDGNAEMKFSFRAAPDRPPLSLYRMPHGGFTSNRDIYLRVASQRGIHVPLNAEGLN